MSNNNPIIIRDTPIRLVIWIVIYQIIFSSIYLIVALISGSYVAFDEGLLLNIITYDLFTFIVLVLLQQIITMYLLLRWIHRLYKFQEYDLILTEGIFPKKTMKIPHRSIKTIKSHKSLLGRIFNYGTITIALINQPKAVVIPYMTNPDQVIKYLESNETYNSNEYPTLDATDN